MISKKRKRKKPRMTKKNVRGTHSIVMRNPMISSMTIFRSSLTPQYAWAFSEVHTARKKKARRVIS